MNSKPWLKEEDEIVKKFYRKIPITEILKLLPDRNEHTVWSRASKLKVSKPHKKEDFTGFTNGLVTVIGFSHKNKDRNYWTLKCHACSKIYTALTQSIRLKNMKSCGCLRGQQNGIRLYKGVGDLSGQYWRTLERGAKERNLEFNITKEYAYNLFLEQSNLCALSGEPITLYKSFKYRRTEQSASLDRIDSSKGYIEGNVQWVHKRVNFMKGAMGEGEFFHFVKKIYERQCLELMYLTPSEPFITKS